MKKGPYEVISSSQVYKNPWIEVREDKVLGPDGKQGTFGVIDYGSGVSIVALDSRKNIYLVREYYYAIEQYGLQVPSGGIDEKETPLETAKRELKEETGITAKKWAELGFTNPLTMILKSPAYLFLAFNLEDNGIVEKGIEIVKTPFDKAYEMVLSSEINHAPSCLAIMKAKVYLDNNKLFSKKLPTQLP